MSGYNFVAKTFIDLLNELDEKCSQCIFPWGIVTNKNLTSIHSFWDIKCEYENESLLNKNQF